MPRQLQQRLEQVKIRSYRAAQEKLDAVRVQTQIQEQGREVSCKSRKTYRHPLSSLPFPQTFPRYACLVV